MLITVAPKLPMRNKAITKAFYLDQLCFEEVGQVDYPNYLMVQKDTVELHFFALDALDPAKNYGGVYIRTDAIDAIHQSLLARNVPIHPAGALQTKPWRQRRFALLDPDNNLLTFGQRI